MEDEKNKIHEEKEVENKIEKEDIKKEDISNKQNLTDKIRENPWMASTLVLGILALILLVGNVSGGVTGNVISEEQAGDVILDFVKTQTKGEGEVIEAKEFNDYFYEVIILLQEGEVPLYITKDGEYFTSNLISFEDINNRESSQQQEPVDWSVFENELPADMKSKILSFVVEESKEYDASMRINEFANYDLIPKTLISFYGAGCGWCTKYHPVLVEAMEKYPEITIYTLDLSENRDIAEKYGATGTPANVINGKYFVSGYRPIEDLSEILEALK